MKRRRKLGGVLVHLVLIIGALFWLAPLLLALMNSFKTNGELLTNVLSIPESLNFENYARTLDKMHYFRSLGNTVLLSGVSVTLIILFHRWQAGNCAGPKRGCRNSFSGFLCFPCSFPSAPS